jgi:hypothetical protein
MPNFLGFLEGALLAAIGAFMAIAPTSANRISHQFSFVRVGGRSSRAIGLIVFAGGLVLIAYHLAN